jgi:glycosyltransferase involved in cell wall biosynthesis
MSSTENSWVGKTPLLTVAIPVFNRGKSAAVIAEALAPQLRDADVEALIIDDGSSDGSWELLQDIQKVWPQLRMLRNVKNLGYPLTFSRCMEAARGEWVLMATDDDKIDIGNIGPLTTWLPTSTADFVSTQWFPSDHKWQRARSFVATIQPNELREASDHAPGLIYRRSFVLKLIPRLRQLIAERSDAALVFPQVIIAAEAVARGTGWWYPLEIVSPGLLLESGITDSQGLRHWEPLSRLCQVISFDSIFQAMIGSQSGPGSPYIQRCRQLLRANECRIFQNFEVFMHSSSPGLARKSALLGLRWALRRLLRIGEIKNFIKLLRN